MSPDTKFSMKTRTPGMDRINGFLHVMHTSTCSADDSSGVIEGHVTSSSDVTFSLDFPLARESYVNSPLSGHSFSTKRRDHKGISHRDHKVSDNNAIPSFLTYNSASCVSAPQDMDKRRTEKMSKTSTKIAEACGEFSDITTFHGMRFVCARKLHLIRRLVWLVLVLACFAVLLLQVYQQVIYFQSNPKSVNVEVKHEPYVEFPSVTICNENSFKITAAWDKHLYNIINKMMTGALTLEELEEAGVADMKLDEFNYEVGNFMDTMLLRCKWGEDERCGPENFTRIITDQGLCFTFNGPNSTRTLTVESPGLSKGLQLTLNIEEYERMAGAHVASGIHLLVHMKREYPLVEQLGQAVAAGSHSFVALSLKKEHRLGKPYDKCEERTLTYISNLTYDYDLPACETDCFVAYVVKRCGCKDYFMPGDVEFCTFRQYVTCLHGAQKDYPAEAEKYCACTIPCKSAKAEPTYSFAALSSYAINKIKKEDIDKILPRYKKALDVHEYLDVEDMYKKGAYRNFGKVLNILRTFSKEEMTPALKQIKTNIQDLKAYMLQLAQINENFMRAQLYIVRKNFVEAKNEMDERTLGELADDAHIFSDSIENKIKTIASTNDQSIRDVLYILLIEQLTGRKRVVNLGLENFTQLVDAYRTGKPLFNYSLPADILPSDAIDAESIVPKGLLTQALDHSMVGKTVGLSAHSLMLDLVSFLQQLLEISESVYKARAMSPEQETYIDEIIGKFKETCFQYLRARENFYEEIIDWPLAKLQVDLDTLQTKKDKCLGYFDDFLSQIDRLVNVANVTVDESLSVFLELDEMLQAYLEHWNVTKFEVAETALSLESETARSGLNELHQKLNTHIETIGDLSPRLDDCMKFEVLNNDSVRRFFIVSSKDLHVEDVEVMRTMDNVTTLINHNFQRVLQMKELYLKLQKLIDNIADDMREFNDSAVLDNDFYSTNFIFLDIFFTDISYTVTEHQAAYDIVKLLSDIGGSMGLLVGASAISLFEFFDLFCVIAALLWKASRKSGERPVSTPAATGAVQRF